MAHLQNKKPPEVSEERAREIRKEIDERIAKEKETFQRQLQLLEKGITPEYLIECASYFQPSHYADIITERAIADLCGYPLCSNSLPKDRKWRSQKYTISVKKKQVYDVSELKSFCSEECLISSQFYMKQLEEEPVYLRTRPTRVILRTGNVFQKKEKIQDKSKKIQQEMQVSIIERETDFSANEPPSLAGLRLKDNEEKDTNMYQVQREIETQAKESDEEVEESEEEDLLQLKVPKSLKIELTSFGLLFTFLEEWCSKQTKELLKGSKEISSSITRDEDSENRRQILSLMVAPHLQKIIQVLKISLPNVEQDVEELLSTFIFKNPIPGFSVQQLIVLSLLFLYLVTSSSNHFDIPYQKLGVDPYEFKELVEIFGKEPFI